MPGTRAAFRSGVLTRDKALIIAGATMLLDPAEARAAEAMVLDRAGSLTPAGLRSAISRAVMQVNPEKARKRREHGAKQARVARWAEPSGNAGLTGRELPPAEVLAADQRITWWARQLRQAGLDGGMDLLRARAFLDILLGIDSRPLGTRTSNDPAHKPADATPATTPSPARTVARGPDGGARPGWRVWSAWAPGAGSGRAAGRGDPARVRRPGQPHHPPGHPAAPGRPARRDARHRPPGPRSGPRPGRRGGPHRPVHLVRDRDRPGRPRHRAWLRPSRPRPQPGEPPETP